MAQQNPKVLDGSRTAAIGIVGDRTPELRVHRATGLVAAAACGGAR